MSSIKLANINLQSIKNKSIQLNNFIIKNDVKLIALTETWLKKDDAYLNIPDNYAIIRKDRTDKKGGGIALIHHISIKIHELTSTQTEINLDEVLILNATHKEQSFAIVIVYAAPSSNSNFEFLDKYLYHNKKETIVMGDLNAKHPKWFCPHTNKKGICLNEIVDDHNLAVINNDTPTYKYSKNILDLILATAAISCKINNYQVHKDDMLSDHYAVTCQLELTRSTNPNVIMEIKLHNKVNWSEFNIKINEKLTNIVNMPILNKNDLNLLNDEFTDIITTTLKDLTPVAMVKTKNPNLQRLPRHVIDLIKEKRKYKRLYTKTHLSIHKSMINNLNNKVKKEIKKISSLRWNELCSITINDKPAESKFWGKLKQIENGKATHATILPKHLISDEEKANKLADHFKDTFRDNRKTVTPKPSFIHMKQNEITISELNRAIKEIKTKAASGLDKISNRIISNMSDLNRAIILKIFNASLELATLPDSWKIAKIILIPKKESILTRMRLIGLYLSQAVSPN